jgi:hypothetical protein
MSWATFWAIFLGQWAILWQKHLATLHLAYMYWLFEGKLGESQAWK